MLAGGQPVAVSGAGGRGSDTGTGRDGSKRSRDGSTERTKGDTGPSAGRSNCGRDRSGCEGRRRKTDLRCRSWQHICYGRRAGIICGGFGKRQSGCRCGTCVRRNDVRREFRSYRHWYRKKGSETGTEASGQDASDKKKDTEAGTTETGSDSEKSSEADDKKKDENKKKDQAGETDPALAQTLSFTVRTKDGTALSVSAIQTPAQITCQGTAHPVDYADGIFQVTVPKGTDALQLSVQKTGKDCGTGLADLLFFARWGGYFTETESKWQLCPYLLDGDTALYSAAQVSGVGVYPLQLQDGTCTLPLEKFTFKGSEMSVEQRTVYGITDEDGMYAEIALGVLGATGRWACVRWLLVKVCG